MPASSNRRLRSSRNQLSRWNSALAKHRYRVAHFRVDATARQLYFLFFLELYKKNYNSYFTAMLNVIESSENNLWLPAGWMQQGVTLSGRLNLGHSIPLAATSYFWRILLDQSYITQSHCRCHVANLEQGEDARVLLSGHTHSIIVPCGSVSI